MNKKKISLGWFRTVVLQVVVTRGRKRTCAQVKLCLKTWINIDESSLLNGAELFISLRTMWSWASVLDVIQTMNKQGEDDQVAKIDIYLEQPHPVKTYLERIEAASVDWHRSWPIRRLLKRMNITSRSSLASKKPNDLRKFILNTNLSGIITPKTFFYIN